MANCLAIGLFQKKTGGGDLGLELVLPHSPNLQQVTPSPPLNWNVSTPHPHSNWTPSSQIEYWSAYPLPWIKIHETPSPQIELCWHPPSPQIKIDFQPVTPLPYIFPGTVHTIGLYHLTQCMPIDVIIAKWFLNYVINGLQNDNLVVKFVFQNAVISRSRLGNTNNIQLMVYL